MATTWGFTRMWEDSRYFWGVLCKSRWFHIRQSLSLNFRQKIPLAETDAVSPCPLSGILPFTVRCDKCGKEFSYRPSDVLRFELEDVPDSFTPHPLFRDEAPDSIVADKTSGNVGY